MQNETKAFFNILDNWHALKDWHDLKNPKDKPMKNKCGSKKGGKKK